MSPGRAQPAQRAEEISPARKGWVEPHKMMQPQRGGTTLDRDDEFLFEGARLQACRKKLRRTAALAAAVRIAVAVVIVIAAAASLYASDSNPFVSAAPTTPVKLRAGQSATADFRFHVADGYHINSSRPKSDLLIPTELKLQPVPPLAVKDFQYPAGKDLTLSFDPSEHLSVYSGDFTVHAQLTAARGAVPGHYQLAGELRYQACSDRACYPPKKLPLTLEVDVLPAR